MSEHQRHRPPDEMSRRSFVRLLGTSLALAGAGGCVRAPREKILPYVSDPPEHTPGVPQHYATSMTLDGYATGLLVESHEGHPTKVEGNPDHPASLGGSGVLEQASILQLYDPHRARTIRGAGGRSSWDDVAASLAPDRLRQRVGARGAGLRFLLEPSAAVTEAGLVARVREVYPECRFHRWAPLASAAAARAAATAFGSPARPLYDFASADVVLSLDADFLAAGPFNLRYAREWAARRRPASAEGMNRLYVVESALGPTGAAADHRIAVRGGEIAAIAAAILVRVASLGGRVPAALLPLLERLGGEAESHPWTPALARDLVAHPGRGVVIAGERQPEAVHLLAILLNAACGNLGRTLRYLEPLPESEPAAPGLAELVDAMEAGAVETAVVLESNPAFTSPADLAFEPAFRRVPERLVLGLYENETAALATTFVPSLHYLEAWGDGRAYDGTASLVQPLLAPLHRGKSPLDLLAAIAGDPVGAHELVRRQWRGRTGESGFDARWDEWLQRGIIDDTASPALRLESMRHGLAGDPVPAALASAAAPRPGPASLELLFLPDPALYDGRFANNAWLQELPDPITKLTWGNAALVSPAVAARAGVADGDAVRLRYRDRELEVPAMVVPGQADGCVALRLGYGRRAAAESVALGVGFDAYRLRTADAPVGGGGLTLVRAPGGAAAAALARTQDHWRMEGRPHARAMTLEDYRRHPPLRRSAPLSLYQPERHEGRQWAMTIDLGACTGCSACVVACQAENNVPSVGKEGVLDGREMHWLRIDRYVEGGHDASDVRFQPMLCQHCEKAPCEYVCPVEATVHSPDGLNEMVYNRCVGTRFCSNNCPYKVRRFNWFDYNAELAETVRMAKNPDVTVRSRGVMEKCTFCVQRIRQTEIAARVAGREPAPDEVRTACQQACPTRAITFGSLDDPGSEMVRLRSEPRSYAALGELGTEPRVRYLARITNPNPALGTPHAG